MVYGLALKAKKILNAEQIDISFNRYTARIVVVNLGLPVADWSITRTALSKIEQISSAGGTAGSTPVKLTC